MYGCFILLPTVGQQTLIIFEKNMKLEVISLLLRIKNNQLIYKLNDKYTAKFSRQTRIVAKVFLGPLFIVAVLINIIPYGYLSIEAYFDPKMDFSLIKLIINYILFTIFVNHGIAYVWLALVVFFYTTLYLKYHFQQIKEQIQECVKTGNPQLLIDAIHEHNYFTELTEKLNEMLSIGLGTVYFCGTPAFDILLHLSIYSENSYVRFFMLYSVFKL
jgi:hypothetical protein